MVPSNPFQAQLGISLNITISSQSYIDYKFTRISLDSLYLVNPDDPSGGVVHANTLVGAGSVSNPTFTAMSDSAIVFPINITFTTNQSIVALSTDANVQALAIYCGSPDFGLSSPGVLKLRYILCDVRYSVLLESPVANLVKLFYPPEYSGVFSMKCPSSVSSFITVVGQALGRGNGTA